VSERAKHTPGEWIAVGAEVRAVTRRVADCDNHTPYVRDAEGEANAREIARRWNAHPLLVAACRVALKRMADSLAIRVKLTGISTGAIADEVDQLRAALSLAEATP